jgi:hypothetical protein
MSQKIAEQADALEPRNLRVVNLGSSCHRYTRILAGLLRQAGHRVQFIAKTGGEGQYIPPGFGTPQVLGRDGTTKFTITGVSHDGLYVDGIQVDTAGGANENERPIYSRTGDPNWSFDPNDGPQILARPTWSEIPIKNWRNNNPPLPSDLELLLPLLEGLPNAGTPTPGPGPVTPPPSTSFRLPTYGELGDAAFFVGKVGVPLDEDMHTNGETMNAGSADWIGRAIHGIIERFIKHGDHRDADAIAKKVRNEWRAVMNNPKLPQLP